MTAAPHVNGQIIGQAPYATRAVLERRPARTGITFHQSVALDVTADGGAGVDRGHLVGRMTGTLKTDDATALATITELTASGLVEAVPGDGCRIRLTDAGRDLNREIRAAADEITARLYDGLDAREMAVAGRLLTLVTARANAEPAGA